MCSCVFLCICVFKCASVSVSESVCNPFKGVWHCCNEEKRADRHSECHPER